MVSSPERKKLQAACRTNAHQLTQFICEHRV